MKILNGLKNIMMKLLQDSETIPLDYGEIQGKKDIEKFRKNITNTTDEEDLKEEYIEKIRRIELEKSILLRDFDEFF